MGLIVLAIATAAMLTLSRNPGQAVAEVALWAYPVVVLAQPEWNTPHAWRDSRPEESIDGRSSSIARFLTV